MVKSSSLEQCFIQKELIWNNIKSIKWMNQRALDKEQYQPAFIEHIANIITHGVWIFPSILGMNELYKRSQDNAQVLSAIVYGITLISLFCISTSFHCVFYCQNQRTLKDILHRCDRGMIYIFIAGSYFPWLTIEKLPQEGWASHMRWVTWLMAIMGVIYQQIFHEKYKRLEIIFYLIMGICPVLPILSELYQYKIKNVEPMKSPSYRLNTLHNYKGNLARSLDTIGGGGILSSRALHYYGRNPLASRRRLDSIGGGGILSARGLDSIGGGGLLRSIDDIGGGGILSARSMDGIGGGGILEARSMDGIGGGGILGARSMDGIGGGGILGARSMDGIGGGGILGARSMDGIGGGGILESRSMDDIGGGGILRSIDDIGDGGILEARDMDDIGGGGILDSRGLFDGGFFGYRNVDNIGGGGILTE
uniref:Monocyte to macrophage differentiation factor 2 n=1 Tax=Dendroctonus ponderosae TaxID=77166 RepID=A0AAR5PGY8_DENPD